MPRLAQLACVVAVACAHPVPVATPEAQLAAINARCAALAMAATRDSQVIDVGTSVSAANPERELSREYQQYIGQGIRQFLSVPKPLSLDVYDDNVEANGYASGTPSRYAVLTLHSVFRATLHRDGRLGHARTLGGALPSAFDDSVIQAMVALDTSRLLPAPLSTVNWFVGDSAELRIVITAKSVRRVPGRVYPEDLTWSEPLFRVRVPIHRIDHGVRRLTGLDPRYPETFARGAMPGKVVIQFIVGIEGNVDMSTIHILAPLPPAEFVNATVDAIRGSTFAPMVVAGCPVRTLIQQPFVFLVR